MFLGEIQAAKKKCKECSMGGCPEEHSLVQLELKKFL